MLSPGERVVVIQPDHPNSYPDEGMIGTIIDKLHPNECAGYDNVYHVRWDNQKKYPERNGWRVREDLVKKVSRFEF